MAWVGENEVKGQEAYKMERVADHRKVDTEAKHPDEVDGAEPELLNQSEWVRGTNADLAERYGARVEDSTPDGKY